MSKGIYKRGFIWWITYVDPNGIQRFESSKSRLKADAEYLLACKRKDIREGTLQLVRKKANYTFSQLAEKYLEFVKTQRSFRSKKGFIKLLLNEFGSLPLNSFNVMLVEQYQSKRLAAGKKPATVNRAIATLKHSFTKALDWEMISEEMYRKIRKVKLFPEHNRRLRYLAKEECQTLVSNCRENLKPIVITALHTGMRKSKILSLKWDRVDLRHGFILLDVTKNGERHEIPINNTLRATLQGIRRRLDIPYVFFDPITRRPYKDVKKSFASARKKSGIKDFKFHDLRHTFASHLIMAGVDITTVKDLLGHKSLTMTLRYAHLAPGHKAKALDILDSKLSRNNKVNDECIQNGG